jgi:hypothetical protein
MRYQQDLQASLRERLRRLMVADYADASHEVHLVTGWIDEQPALHAILAEAERAEPGLDPGALVSALSPGGVRPGGQFQWPSRTEAGRAFLIWQLMLSITTEISDGVDGIPIITNYAHVVSDQPDLNDKCREFTQRIIQPLFDYLGERIGAESSVLYVLERYVRRVEWFDRDDLYARAMQDTRKAEDVYDADLRRFLFSEGINMPFSQARSASGLSDVLADLDTDDPLVCEVKIFDAVNRGIHHLTSGVNQAIQYATDYGKQVAYLVVINLSDRPFTLPSEDDSKNWPPRIIVAGIRVYLITVRALPTPSASKPLNWISGRQRMSWRPWHWLRPRWPGRG